MVIFKPLYVVLGLPSAKCRFGVEHEGWFTVVGAKPVVAER